MSKPWFKLSTDKWLDGSTRRELTDAERAKFVDLLALCARYEGKHANTSGVINMSVPDLAYFWHEEESEIRPVLVKMEMAGKIKVFDDRVEIVNWKRYNPHPEELKREEFVSSCEELCTDVTKIEIEKQIEKENKKQTKKEKGKFGEFDNVLLTHEEFDKLNVQFGDRGARNRVETLSVGIKSKGYKYKDHYATILAWARKDEEKNPVKEEPTSKEYLDLGKRLRGK